MVNFIGKRKIPFAISSVLFVVSIVSLITFGVKTGIDFTGGSLLEVTFSENRPGVDELQSTIQPLDLGTVVIQPTGDDGMVLKMRFITETEHESILSTVRKSYEIGDVKVLEQRFETIGPSVSAQLRNRAFGTGVAVMLAILLFIAYAFRRVSRPVKSWNYGVAALVALAHDVIITIGAFVFMSKYLGAEADIPFVVAILTVLGYSVNDTIVVFDRIRENLIRRPGPTFADTVNTAVNETVGRSINTSMTVLLVLTALFLFGGSTIHYFTLTLIVGIFIGTYSSIFIASPVLVSWYEWRQKRRNA
ncbi:MAG: protein translocase subunit SecF [Candidatus Magasanikbacteria bacterium]|nr:protein translocase subunit SecF [Candidatus Magasanikbacteria bacterium]